jgi:ribokinase
MNMDLNIYGVPKISQYGESVGCEAYKYATGGKGANQAYAAALQGANVTMVGRVGDDANGNILVSELEKVGINTDYIVSERSDQTGLATIMVDDRGQYFSYVTLGANNSLIPEDVERALNVMSFDMVLMQLEMPLETVYRTYELAKERNIPVFLDAGPAMDIPLDRLKDIYIISPNEAETEALTGIAVKSETEALDAAIQLYERANPQYVVLKMGSRGSYVYDGQVGKMHPAYKVDAIDSTGAGDTFNASLVNKLCLGYSLDDAIDYAAAAAAICVSRKGAQISIPSEMEVQQFIGYTKTANSKN